MVAVPGGCWKALRLRPGASYALMANTLSPEFTPDRVKIGEGPAWVKRFTNSAPWATPQARREFIGPNWMPELRSGRPKLFLTETSCSPTHAQVTTNH